MIYLIDLPKDRYNLYPLSPVRALSDIRHGILTQAERWGRVTGQLVTVVSAPHLFLSHPPEGPEGPVLVIRSTVIAQPRVWAALSRLDVGQILMDGDEVIGALLPAPPKYGEFWPEDQRVLTEGHMERIVWPWDLYLQARARIHQDFELVTAGRQSTPIDDPHTRVYAPERIFLEPGARVRASILNAQAGPIYIGPGAEVQEGAMIAGAHAIGTGSTVNMGAKLRGDSVIGPYSKVGGEVANSVVMGYSNKGHDGYLGNSVLGLWCNLGADTNTSNLKNNYSNVRVKPRPNGTEVDTEQLFCGLIMGDHGKAGINTMFNTGTIVGPGSSLFGGGYMPKTIAPFSWGGPEDMMVHTLEKLLMTEQRVMARRGLSMAAAYEQTLTALYADPSLMGID